MHRRTLQLALIGAFLLAGSAQAGATIPYYGGRVMPSVRIIPIYYGSSWAPTLRNSTQAYLTDLTSYIAGGKNQAGQQTVYAQYGMTGAVLDPIRSVGDVRPRVLQPDEITDIIHTFQTQNNIPYSAEKVFLLLPGPRYGIANFGPCGSRLAEGDGKYYAFVGRECSTFNRSISMAVLAAAASPNSDGWIGPLDPCASSHAVNFNTGDIALPWDNSANACSTTGFNSKTGEILQVVVTNDQNHLFHTIRHDTYWDQFADVGVALGSNPRLFFDADAQATLGVFNHVVAVDGFSKLYHTIRTDFGWTPWVDVSAATNAGSMQFGRVGLANVNGDLHVCATTNDTGRVMHAIRYQNGTWTGMGDVFTQTGMPGGPDNFIRDVDCAGFGADLQIVMSSSAGSVFHAIRYGAGTGSWSALGNVNDQAGPSNLVSHVTATNFLGDLLVTVNGNGVQFTTVRHSSGSWGPFMPLQNNLRARDEGSAGGQTLMHLVSVDADAGVVYHQTRDGNTNLSGLGNVYQQAGSAPGFALTAGTTISLGY